MKLIKIYRKIGKQQNGNMENTDALIFIDNSPKYVVEGIHYENGIMLGFDVKKWEGVK